MIPILNQQHLLAEEFHANDISVMKANHEAILQIKRWKFIHNISVLSKNIINEADNMLYSSLLTYIDNHEILICEGFFDAELQN